MMMRLTIVAAATVAIACGAGTKPGRTAAFDAKGRPLPVASNHEGHGVSITGEHAYDDRHDPSGWSGKTAPSAVGGGPSPAPSPAPSAPPSAAPKQTSTPAAAPSANPLPPSKELDTTPPSKELQF